MIIVNFLGLLSTLAQSFQADHSFLTHQLLGLFTISIL